MIVPMRKICLVSRQTDRQALLGLLRGLGVVHLVPVDPSQAMPDEATHRQIEALKQALQMLAGVEPRGPAPEIAPVAAAQEVLTLERQAAEARNHLAALYHQLEQIAIWGELRLEQVEQLRAAGVRVEFYAVPAMVVDRIQAECWAEIGQLPDRRQMVVVADRSGTCVLPDQATPMPLPPRDAAAIRDEARQIDKALHRHLGRLHELAPAAPAMREELRRLKELVEETVAVRGALADDHLLAMQGWLPAENVATLEQGLTRQGLPAMLDERDPDDDELPPTLVRPPAWARPIEGLFSVLGTVPGYREFDVSIPFLIALPIFTAILISDAGYGGLLLLGPALAYPWAARTFGTRFTQLLMLIGLVSVIWGVVTNTFFGFPLLRVTWIPIELSETSRLFMMRLSFILGAIHLSLAQLWQAVRHCPDLRALSKTGWALFIWGMFGVVNMFVLQGPLHWQTPFPYLLISGAALAILFASPNRNLLKMIGLGAAQFPLSMLSAFSDVISYVRLMAVGLASSVLATNFNTMALDLDFWPLALLVLLFGHGLNLGLALIAMFAHGVRLNMLEFCSNLGMQWVGYPYKPFSRPTARTPWETAGGSE